MSHQCIPCIPRIPLSALVMDGRKLGSGGYGSVVAATLAPEVFSRPGGTCACVVAVKTPSHGVDLEHEREMYEEIGPHPHIVRCITFTEVGSLVLEMMSGTLSQALQGGWFSEISDVVDVLHGLLDALDHMHAKRLIHCDVRPPNIMFCTTGGGVVWKLVDMGLAQRTDDEADRLYIKYRSRLAHLSADAALTSATDVFAVGVVSLELLLGGFITHRNTLNARVRYLKKNGAAALRREFRECPAASEILDFALLCLHRSPALRPGISGYKALLARL